MDEGAQTHRGKATGASRLRLELHPEAVLEVEAAEDWYDSQRLSLGSEFIQELKRSFETILMRPEAWPIWTAESSRHEIRRFVMPRFPFAIAYQVSGGKMVILAVAHVRRRPLYWLSRVEDR